MDQFYAQVPFDQTEALRHFRESHPQKSLTVAEQEWQYIAGGAGSETVVFLSDGLAGADAWYVPMQRIEPITRVISVAHPPAATSMADLTEGLEAILQAENTRQAHLVGSALGGCVVQCFMRMHPHLVNRVVLSNTYVPSAAMGSRIGRKAAAFRLLGSALGKWTVARERLQHLKWVHKAERPFWTAYMTERMETAWTPSLQRNVYACLLDFNRNYECLPEDVENWAEKRILLTDSNDDPVVKKGERHQMYACYPQAQTYQFKYAGHMPHISRAFEYAEAVFEFVAGLQTDGLKPMGAPR